MAIAIIWGMPERGKKHLLSVSSEAASLCLLLSINRVILKHGTQEREEKKREDSAVGLEGL